MDENYSKGQRLFVETIDGTVEGVLHSMDPGHNKLTMKKVILHPSGKEVDGLSHYYRNEVLRIRVLQPGSYTGVNKEGEAAGEWNLMRKAQSPMLSNKPLGEVTEADVVMNFMPKNGNSTASASRRERLTEEEYDNLNKLVQSNVLIDRLGDVFKSAVTDIKKESSVGVHVEGARLGRRSRVNILCIATPSRIFLFDIKSLGESAFDEGLKDILECTKIEKVIHDCRLVSDCLYHVHKVSLNFVFDTQVADLMITQQRCREFPRCVRSLPECLTVYLNLPDNLIYKPQIQNGYIVTNQARWQKRPLLMELQGAAAKSTVYLLHLRKKIFEEMIKPFHEAVDIFCNTVKDADQYDASQHEANCALVPMELLSLNDSQRSTK